MDIECLHTNILTNLSTNLIAKAHLLDSSNPRWSTDEAGYLHLNGHVYVPEANNLRLHVLKYKHDHPLLGHFGQNPHTRAHPSQIHMARHSYLCEGLHQILHGLCLSQNTTSPTLWDAQTITSP